MRRTTNRSLSLLFRTVCVCVEMCTNSRAEKNGRDSFSLSLSPAYLGILRRRGNFDSAPHLDSAENGRAGGRGESMKSNSTAPFCALCSVMIM